MSKTTEMAKVSAKGGFHLLWGMVLSTVISAVGAIIMAQLLGADNYGLYAIAFTAPDLLMNFRDWGVNSAMIKYTAQFNSRSNLAKIREVFVSGVLFEVGVGLILSIVSLSLSGMFASYFNRPAIAPLIQIASFMILATALVTAATAAFTGMEKMHLNSVMLIVQAIVKTTLTIALILSGLSAFGAITGFTIAVIIAGIIGILLTYTIYKSLPKTEHKLEIKTTTKILLKYGIPLSIGTSLGGILTQFYNSMMAIYVSDNAAIGNYNVALNFVVLITFFSTPVLTMLFPAFSKLDYRKDSDALKNVFQYSVKYASLVVIPVATMVMVLAQPAINTLFQGRYNQAPLFLALMSITYLYTAIGSLSVGNLLNSQGYTTTNMKLAILTAAVGFPLGFILIYRFAVIGLIASALIVSLPSLFIGLFFVRKKFGVSLELKSSLKILLSSLIAGAPTYLLISEISLVSVLKLLLGIIVFIVLYVCSLLVSGAIEKSDIDNLREIVTALGPLKRPLNYFLNLLEKILSKLKKAKIILKLFL